MSCNVSVQNTRYAVNTMSCIVSVQHTRSKVCSRWHIVYYVTSKYSKCLHIQINYIFYIIWPSIIVSIAVNRNIIWKYQLKLISIWYIGMVYKVWNMIRMMMIIIDIDKLLNAFLFIRPHDLTHSSLVFLPLPLSLRPSQTTF